MCSRLVKLIFHFYATFVFLLVLHHCFAEVTLAKKKALTALKNVVEIKLELS